MAEQQGQQEGFGGAAIVLESISKDYGAVSAVDDISLTVSPGEFMTFLGPSGSGKTTTLNLIAGFVDVTDGRLCIDGRDISNTPAHKRDIGMVFQSYALFPHMTVAENVTYPLRQRRISKAAAADMVSQALAMVKLDDYANRFPSELSGGQQQRVALARALVYRPKVLLMDEPLGALDKKLREWLQSEIKRIHRELGTTFVYVTHDQEEALSLSDRIAVFNGGRIEQLGSAEELYEKPATLFVAKFVGESTVFHGEIQGLESSSVMDFMGTKVYAPGRLSRDRGAILVRPEKLVLREAPSSDADDTNSVPVQVINSTYMGSVRKCSVLLQDGSHGVVRMPASQSDVEVGGAYFLEWKVVEGILLEDDGASDTFNT